MKLQINGESRTCDSGLTIGQLLNQLELLPDRVVIELNQNILSTEDGINTTLKDADSLEIIQFVGGG